MTQYSFAIYRPDDYDASTETEAMSREAAKARRRSVRLFDPLENFVYWLISAAALTAVMFGAMSSMDFARHAPSSSSNYLITER